MMQADDKYLDIDGDTWEVGATGSMHLVGDEAIELEYETVDHQHGPLARVYSWNIDEDGTCRPFNDPVSPQHYRTHPSGVECVEITEHMNFNLGNAVMYLWRAGLKGDAVYDLRKARWYVDREIARLGGVSDA